MNYLIHQLAEMAGVSTRTLRYYGEVGLLSPSANASGYRIYTTQDLDRLQQVLFYKELGFDLKSIKAIITDPEFDILSALKSHLYKLNIEKERLNLLILNVENSIAQKKGLIKMQDKEKFEGFKKTLIDQNEKTYGAEVRQKYGDQSVDNANDRLKNMSKAQFDEVSRMEKDIIKLLHKAYLTGDPSGVIAQEAAKLHSQWITAWWGYYDPASHAALPEMYVEDERFKQYYDKEQPGTAVFLRDAIKIYTANLKE